ncbi:MAG: hypothetical protein ACKV2Q_30875 [Planctomycetaceae bacterium]
MSISLVDALEDVELEAGRTYCCEVRGRQVELRVLSVPPATRSVASVSTETGGLRDEDIRLDPWCEFPLPTPLSRVIPRSVASLPFDIPEIPSDEITT